MINVSFLTSTKYSCTSVTLLFDCQVVFVITDCCMQETKFNPYYGHVAAKLVSLDRKYRVAMQFNLWDRVRQLGEMKKFQLNNLALLAKFLIIEKAQSLGLLKVIEFAGLIDSIDFWIV